MKKRILVTGGAGYIGSHTVLELIDAGYDVCIADNLSNSRAEVIDELVSLSGTKIPFEVVDICNFDQINDFIQKYAPISGVVHFAAFKAVGESVVHPLKYYTNNLVSLMNLLRIMQAQSITNLVFSSSCTVYGQAEKLPVSEHSPILDANSPYGNTKQISEEIIRDMAAAGGIKAIALRYFNPIGAHASGRIGELPIGVPANLVPFITQTAIGLRQQLSIFGNDYNTPDGTAVRDYIHVVDLAGAHVSALNRMISDTSNQNFEVFNIGTGKGCSVMELVNTWQQVTGVKLNYKVVDRRPGDVEQVWADTRLANEVLGWRATRELPEMLLSAWKWEQHYRNTTV